MSTFRSNFANGVRDILPILPGFIPFGVMTGATAVSIGMSPYEAVFTSALVYGGAAQLAAFELINNSTPLAIIIFTSLMINLRFSILSAGIAPYLRPLTRRWKWVSAFLLSEPSFVVSVPRFENNESMSQCWYYFGTAVPMWINWQLATALGVVVGARIPEDLQLEFIIPLVFMVLLFKMLDGYSTRIAALTAGLLAIPGELAPFNSGLVLAALGGIAAGLFVNRGGSP